MSDEHVLPPSEQRRLLVEEVRQLNEILAAEGWTQKGRVGQPRPHWALPARRAALEAIRKLDRQSPPGDEEKDALSVFLGDE